MGKKLKDCMLRRDKNYWTSDIILIDIINFSKLDAQNQLQIITFVTKSYTNMINKMLKDSNMSLKNLILGYISTGDGFYCILNPKLKGYGVILGLGFNHLSEHIAKKFLYFQGLRIAIHTGKIYEFTDILGHKNYIGDGLNDCSRYLEFKNYRTNTVVVSEDAYNNLRGFLKRYPNFNRLLIDMEFKYTAPYQFKDKHSKEKEARLVWLRKAGIINPPHTNFNSILKG